MAHTFVLPENLLPGYVAVLNTELTVAQLLNKGNFAQFQGARNHTVTVRIPGRLPAHSYLFRKTNDATGDADANTINDRTTSLTFDTYSESTVDVKLAGHAYSAVEITDEQANFDLRDANSLVPYQGRAVAAQIDQACAARIQDAPYEFTIGGVSTNHRRGLIEARRVLNALGVPAEQRILLIGDDFEADLLSDEKLTFASNVGDNQAATALHEATLGNLFGFRIVRSSAVKSGEAYAFVPSAFVLRTAQPAVPNSVEFGRSYSAEGFGLRWMRQFNLPHLQDQSVVDTLYGTESVKDVYNYWDETAGQEKVSQTPAFLRGVKLTLEGASEGNDTIASNLGIGSLWNEASSESSSSSSSSAA